MQPRLTVAILVLQAEGLVSSSGYVGFTLQFAPAGIVAKPQRLPSSSVISLGNADLVAVEVVDFLVCFRLRHWCGCVPAPRVRRNPGRCRDRYTCRPVGLPARGGCRPRRIRFLLRGRLKLLFSDGLCLSFCPRHRRCRPKFLSYRLFFEDFGFNQLVVQVVEIVLYFAVGQFAVDQVAEVVVVIAAVVGFQAVVGDGRAVVVGQDIVRGSKANRSFPALVIRPSLSYSKWVVLVRWSVLWVRLPVRS